MKHGALFYGRFDFIYARLPSMELQGFLKGLQSVSPITRTEQGRFCFLCSCLAPPQEPPETLITAPRSRALLQELPGATNAGTAISSATTSAEFIFALL